MPGGFHTLPFCALHRERSRFFVGLRYGATPNTGEHHCCRSIITICQTGVDYYFRKWRDSEKFSLSSLLSTERFGDDTERKSAGDWVIQEGKFVDKKFQYRCRPCRISNFLIVFIAGVSSPQALFPKRMCYPQSVGVMDFRVHPQVLSEDSVRREFQPTDIPQMDLSVCLSVSPLASKPRTTHFLKPNRFRPETWTTCTTRGPEHSPQSFSSRSSLRAEFGPSGEGRVSSRRFVGVLWRAVLCVRVCSHSKVSSKGINARVPYARCTQHTC